MKPRSFQQEVLESNHRIQVVRACRRAGKTELGIDWAVQGSGNALIVATNTCHAKMILGRMEEKYRDKVVRRMSSHVEFSDKKVYVAYGAYPDSYRGLNVDRVVLDDAGYLKEEWTYVCSALIANGEGKMLVLLSGIGENSVGKYFEKYRPVCNYISYSWEDMVKDNILSLRDMADIIKYANLEQLKNEFGPWEEIWTEPLNTNYVGLLRK